LAKQAAADEATRQAARQATEQAAVAEGLKTSGAEAAQNVLQSQAASAGAEGAIGETAAKEFAAKAATQPTTYTFDDGSTLSALRDGTYTSTPGTDVVVAKQPATYGENFENFKRGFGEMSSKSGRTEFGKEFGMTEAGAGIAPLMAPGKKPGEAPVDDEMIVYDYDVGRTGAERMPTSSSAERKYFDGRYSPARRIPAREYPYAEGGEVADDGVAGGMTGASKAAFDYLMGNAASSAPAGGIANLAARATPGVGSDNMYAFDPVTGTFLRNPNVAGAATSGSRIGTSLADFGGGGGGYDAPMSQQTIDFLDRETPAQRDARMGEVQNLFNLGPTGALFSAFRGDEARAPDFGTLFGTGDAYKSLGYDDSPPDMSGFESPSNQSYSAPSGGGIDYGGYSPTSDDASYGGFFAAGGLMGLAKGGMKSGGFVVPADVVSMVGEGNTDAGYSRIKSMIPGATAIKGKDGGQADTVKTSIEGKQPARVAHGEMYIPPETVKRMGGAKKLYAMMDRVRQQATGSKKQIKPVSLKRAMA
jgi:hypothetical protein